jgi:hypothetical protein
VSLTPVVHLELRISPRIFEKIRNGSIGILRGLGETDSWKKQKSKISRHCPFKHPVIIHPTSPLMHITIIHLCFCILPSLQYTMYHFPDMYCTCMDSWLCSTFCTVHQYLYLLVYLSQSCLLYNLPVSISGWKLTRTLSAVSYCTLETVLTLDVVPDVPLSSNCTKIDSSLLQYLVHHFSEAVPIESFSGSTVPAPVPLISTHTRIEFCINTVPFVAYVYYDLDWVLSIYCTVSTCSSVRQ